MNKTNKTEILRDPETGKRAGYRITKVNNPPNTNETYAEWIFRTHRPDNGHTLAKYRKLTGLDRHPEPAYIEPEIFSRDAAGRPTQVIIGDKLMSYEAYRASLDTAPAKPDFTCQFESSLVLFVPETDAACEHLDGITTCSNYHLRFGRGFAVEYGYADDFAEQLVDDGFTVETPAGNLLGGPRQAWDLTDIPERDF